jgi:hypothetical protein
MADVNLLSPWVRRFLMEYLIGERNLAPNTQKSYRDTLRMLLPFAARQAGKSIDRLEIIDLSSERIRMFLLDLEEKRKCGAATRNQRLAGIHSLARFISLHSPEHIQWCGELKNIPVKKSSRPLVTYLEKEEMDALMARQIKRQSKAGAIMRCSCSCTTPALAPTRWRTFRSVISCWAARLAAMALQCSFMAKATSSAAVRYGDERPHYLGRW